MDKRTEDILHNIEHNTLGLDDAFQFKCRGCGKCCEHRDDILLTARDLYNIARSLGRTTEYIIDRYCEIYIGGDSRMPIIRLRPIGPEKACPLLRNKKCIVHDAKPVVCALFPLGRAASMRKTDDGIELPEMIEPMYFVQPITCGNKNHTHTVRSWLTKFGLPVEDEFYSLWTEAITFISEFFRGMETLKLTRETMEKLWNAAIFALYVNYDPRKDLIPQVQSNTVKLMGAIEKTKTLAETVFGGLPNGE